MELSEQIIPGRKSGSVKEGPTSEKIDSYSHKKHIFFRTRFSVNKHSFDSAIKGNLT